MINVIYSDDPAVFDHALFPAQHNANMVYIQQNLGNFANNLTDSGRMFMEHYSKIYASIDHSSIARKARKAVSAVDTMFDASAIVSLETLEQLQNAQYGMVRYLMANPQVRSLYHANRIEGYADIYVDNAPGQIGEDHLDYRRATTGMLVENDNGFRVRIHMDEYDPNDPPLAHDQRVAIDVSWSSAEYWIQKGIDFSNRFGGEVAP